ncbi:sensor histidine kinase [Cryobacterium sp. TMT1-21]|uniref:sensor histidine kinase n=1 Tax=unclassified Cryobacterium TaxID=2649013 RepID=UPI00106AB8CC|nr:MULTISPECIES: sensor histidine kinase [unclassified Cryobacterium]TFD13576.1 sensor histidine kinase [Cryobacterium sp. TMT1-21]TFD17367.1 sensor histidine kinase [Cryobacterium sp. TMT2-23]
MGHDWSIARRLFLANALFILAMTVFVGTAAFVDARDRGFAEAENRMLSVATSIADSPLVLAAARSTDPSRILQPYALRVTEDAGLDFITIMAPDRTRWTHPTPSEIGRPYIGTVKPALAGEPFTEVTTGTLGPSVRAIVPVTDDTGAVLGLVAAGVKTSNLSIALSARLPAVLAVALILLAAGTVASWLLGRYLSRVTLGWGPEQLAQLFVYYDSVLHSVREGLVLVNLSGEVVLYNDQAARLLGVPVRVTAVPSPGPGRRASVAAALSLDRLDLPPGLGALLQSGRSAVDEIHLTDTRVLVVSQKPALLPAAGRHQPAPMGWVATIRDHTDMQHLGSELQSTRTLSDALRAQTHEHANRLHTIVSLMELGRGAEALDFATRDLELSQQLTDDMIDSVDEPVLSALLMGKFAQASELGVLLTVEAAGSLSDSGLSGQDLVTVVGNLVDNALDAAAGGDAPRTVHLTVRATADAVAIEVADSGPGVAPEAVTDILQRGYSTKEPGAYGRGLGLALVRQTVKRLGGDLTITRRVGAVFTVTLPHRDAAGISATPSRATSPAVAEPMGAAHG